MVLKKRAVPKLYEQAIGATLNLFKKQEVWETVQKVCQKHEAVVSVYECPRCCLPLGIREDLLLLTASDQALQDSTKLRILESCMNSAILSLHLRGFADCDFSRICECLRTHGLGLRTLELDTPFPADCRHQNPAAALHYETLLTAFGQMRWLTSLALPGSADDEILRVVASSCPWLLRLDVSFSYTVSDTGLLEFLKLRRECKSTQNLSGQHGDPIICKAEIRTHKDSLSYLNVWATSVTGQGLLKCLRLTRNLSTLVFHNADVMQFPVNGKQNGTALDAEEGFAVKHIVLSRLPETFHMERFSRVFPDLESVFVRGATSNYQMAYLLERCKLRCFKSNHLDGLVNEGLVSRWSSLRQINLRVPGLDVDLTAVATYCPNIEEMRIDNGMFVLGSIIGSSLISKQEQFPCLKRLGLNTPLPIGEHESSYIFLPPAVIAFILSRAPLLECADFGYCSAIYDTDVDRMLQDAGASRVQRLTLRGAYRLSNEAVMKLIQGFPELKMMAMKILPRDRLVEMEKLKTCLKEQNADVTLLTYGNY